MRKLMSAIGLTALAFMGASGGQAVAAPATGGPDPATAASDYKATHNSLKPIPPSSADAVLIRAKDAAAREHFQQKQSRWSSKTTTADATAATSATLGVVRQSQQTEWWCGPATVSEILFYKGRSMSQSTAANQLLTTKDGTNWYGSNNHPSPDPKWNTNFPVRDVMNYNLNTTFYVAPDWVNKSTASTTDQATFKSNVVMDVDNKYAIAADAWEYPGGLHLVKHPIDQEIFHWFAIRGYANSGNTVAYVDSANFAGVTGYSTYESGKLAIILAGRGYIW